MAKGITHHVHFACAVCVTHYFRSILVGEKIISGKLDESRTVKAVLDSNPAQVFHGAPDSCCGLLILAAC